MATPQFLPKRVNWEVHHRYILFEFVTRNRLSSLSIVSARADHLVTNNANHHHTPKLSCNMVFIRTSAWINLTTLQQNIGSELLNPNRCLPEGTCWMRSQLDLSTFESERIELNSKGQSLPWSLLWKKTDKLSWHRPQTGKPVLGAKLKVPFGFRIVRFVRFLNLYIEYFLSGLW